jgi:uncharacterized protein (TIGR02466 family)
MEIVGAFQTPIAVSNIELPSIDHLSWNISRNFLQTEATLQKDEHLKWFVKDIEQAANEFCNGIGHESRKFFITQMWANKYSSNQGIHTHHHANSFFSGVVYFDNVGSTVFLRDSNVKNILQIPILNHTSYSTNIYEVPSESGRMVLFPSYLVHYSTNETDQERISISFNLMPEVLGQEDQFNFLKLK